MRIIDARKIRLTNANVDKLQKKIKILTKLLSLIVILFSQKMIKKYSFFII